MLSLGEKIKKARLKKGYTQTALANLLSADIKNTAISNWENNINKPDVDTLGELCHRLEVSPSYFFDHTGSAPASPLPLIKPAGRWAEPLATAYAAAPRPTRIAACNVLQIPYVETEDEWQPEILDVMAYPCAGGLPVWVENDLSEKKEFPPGVIPRGTSFAIRLAGDSMSPTIPDGAYIFVKQQPDICNREIGVFMLHDEATCKRYYKNQDSIKLLPDNPKYDPIVVPNDQEGFGLVGKVLGHWKP